MVARKTSSRNTSAEPCFAIAIMAAGKGTRLKSKHPKVMHEIGGKPLLQYVVDAAKAVLPANDVFVIIGHEAQRVREAMAGTGVQFVLQAEQLGTGHAIMSARQALEGYDDVLVLSGDVPLLRAETIRAIRDFHLKNNAAMTILTADFPNPAGYGRIVRMKKGGRQGDEVQAIVEQKKLTPLQEKIRESNSGIYAFATKPLFEHLSELRTDNPHGEYYLTDVAAILAKKKAKVLALKAGSQHEVAGANNRAELAQLDAEARARKAAELMAAGVTIFRPETCVIDAAVEVAPDTIIEPFVQLLGETRIGTDCRIQSYSVITSSEIGDGVQVRHGCIITDSRVAPSAVIGPYSHLRPGSDIGPEAHVGNFVETKKAKLGRGAKANHLTYLGDAVIGERVNVGAGTITCNYDGVHKHTTIIEDGAFIGSDSTLVAPVRVGRNAYVGAAACVTEDVPEDALAIARTRQVNKLGWAKAKREEIAAKTKT
ncbi:MAG: bifunctional UDP-N-acetylglucosamine diphosphorylase/glucosamine-1-phosphate N-acetyltransferase GlmU [Terriglobales bacterium]